MKGTECYQHQVFLPLAMSSLTTTPNMMLNHRLQLSNYKNDAKLSEDIRSSHVDEWLLGFVDPCHDDDHEHDD